MSATDDELGEALGRKFVEKTFGEQGKQRTLDMVHEIEHEMAQRYRIADLDEPGDQEAGAGQAACGDEQDRLSG